MWHGNATALLNRPAALVIARELDFACKRIDSKQWVGILFRCGARASVDTARSRYRQLRNLGTDIASTGQRYIKDGVRRAASDDLEHAKSALAGLPGRVQDIITTFRAMTRAEQAEQVTDLMLTWIIFWASAGGADLEGGLPDTDLLLGIGNHRNVLSHTVLLGLGTELAMRFGVEAFGEVCARLPAQHCRAWDTAHAFLLRHRDTSVAAMWAGVGAHFLKDANLLSSATKPYTGMPSMPMDAHQALFAANGAACQITALRRG